ncbi:uncharacterized protein LOC133274695 [Pezoporus flaviventris]|uniref:uncharacterized protein LOC133274695 n=1 Tax=Pezoporus flaviventris TaxID=889875 RepID=UPI002AB22780|nr:uncharacterized protein LOC133274695 [Pezoporus flaviventris]
MAFQKSPDASNATRKNPSLLEIGALCLDSEIIFGFTSHLLRRKAKTPPRVREPPAPTLAVAGKETRSRDWHRWGKPPPPPSPAAAPTRGAGSGSGSVLGGTGSSRVQPHGGAGRWCSGHRHGAVVPGCGARASLGSAPAHSHQAEATGQGSEGALGHSGSRSSLWNIPSRPPSGWGVGRPPGWLSPEAPRICPRRGVRCLQLYAGERRPRERTPPVPWTPFATALHPPGPREGPMLARLSDPQRSAVGPVPAARPFYSSLSGNLGAGA